MMWWIRLNAVLGSLVVTLGFWMIWGELPLAMMVALGLAGAGLFAWLSQTIGAVWAWATLFLGIESLAWPIVTMVQVRMAGAEPTEREMGLILTAMLFGLFSAIFWMTFAYGIFKWMRKKADEASEPAKPVKRKPR